MMMDNAEAQGIVAAPVTKIATAWAAWGFTSWSDIAAFLAALYTACLIAEWTWKKVLRPIGEGRGWLKRKYRRATDADC